MHTAESRNFTLDKMFPNLYTKTYFLYYKINRKTLNRARELGCRCMRCKLILSIEHEILKYKICVCWRIFKKYMWIYCCYIIIFSPENKFLLLHSLTPSCTLGHFMLPYKFFSCFSKPLLIYDNLTKYSFQNVQFECIYIRRNFEPNFYAILQFPNLHFLPPLKSSILPRVHKNKFSDSEREDFFSISNCNEYIKFQFIIYLISNDTRDS